MNIYLSNRMIKKIVGERDIKDYTYSILFFLISAFFAFFAIKPALTTAFSLQSEVIQLQETNNVYNSIINRIVTIQGEMIDIRNEFILLDRAVTKMPQIKNLIEDINEKAKKKGFVLEKMQISPLRLKENTDNSQPRFYTLSLESILTFEQFNYLRKELLTDIRLKLIKEITLKKVEAKNASGEAQLSTQITLDIYYF